MFWSSLICQNWESETEIFVVVSSELRFKDEFSVPLLPFTCCSQRDDSQIHQRRTGTRWVRLAVPASRSGAQPATTRIGPSTWTSGTCPAWAALQAPCHPLLCREPPCTGETWGLLQGGFALSLLLTDHLSTCPRVSHSFPFCTSFISIASPCHFFIGHSLSSKWTESSAVHLCFFWHVLGGEEQLEFFHLKRWPKHCLAAAC